MMSEILSTDIKWMAGYPMACNFGLAFLSTKTFTNLRNMFGMAPTFWIFSALSFLGSAFCYFLVPETKGKSLAEIQLMLAGNKI